MSSKYLRNNIGFRRSSANQYANFYNSKAYLLGEILDGPKSNIFSTTAREILLQYFSAMELLLREIEMAFIACGDGVVQAVTITSCTDAAKEFSENLRQIIADNPDDFDPVFAEPWSTVVGESAAPIMDVASSYLDGDIETAFCLITNYSINYLNHVTFMLHELTCLMAGDAPILYLSDIDVKIQERKSFSPASARLTVYRDFGLLADSAEIKVLCSFDDAKIRNSERSMLAYRSLLDSIANYSLKLS